ncbi:hypothetical protein [Aquibacillus salsiterrae]|uniref:Uncharacterized protein n=1 Tax=Aquibacillus salsiterrae TaxID=2950439 RepID=A0A9X3WH71_9BACI|nr:hypothetical protein [Aquibacillus salsiterrae]MDC3417389.1 hypothetical protein [Aquibacillus salsiterrae]
MRKTILFNSIDITITESNSAVFIGKNKNGYWDANNKNLSSLGTITGVENKYADNVNIIKDNDFIDTPILTKSINKRGGFY